ncbi:MAG: cyclic nucleotide-binding domain-containing protein [Sphingomonas bacterium]
MRVAVLGGGAAGMGAAWGLAKAGCDVTIFELAASLGGHCMAIAVPLPDGGELLVDVGVSDFNRATFTNVSALFDELGLTYRPICQDASFMHPDRATAWFSRAGEIHAFEPFADEARFREEIARFRLECIEVLSDPALRDCTLETYLDLRGYSREFRDLYLYPRAQGSFPMPDADPATYQARGLVAFWRIHGIAGPGPADRNVLEGGMHSYGRAFADWLARHGGVAELGAEVVGVARRADGVRVRFIDARKEHRTASFDHVVFAVRSHQVVPLLEDANEEEKRVFESFLWHRARVSVHQDERLMPDRREAWGAYNYILNQAGVPEIRPTITFYPNKLAGLPPGTPDVFVTLNPFREPDPAKLLLNQFFSHPAAGAATDLACARVEQMQGIRGTWYCGSYLTRPWVHEQALASGVELAETMRRRFGEQESGTRMPHFDDFLRTIPLFAGLDPFALTDVQLAAERFTVEAGGLVFRQNDVGDGLYLIASGTVRVSVRTPGDGVMDLVALGPGGLLGEFSLIDGDSRSATAQATEPTAGYFISRRRFDAMRGSGRPAAFEVIDRIRVEVARRARATIATIASDLGEPDRTSLADGGGVAALIHEPITHNPTGALCAAFLAHRQFGEMTPNEAATLLALCTRIEAPRGTLLAREGDAPTHLFLVLRGAIRAGLEHGAGQAQLEVHGPGKMAGLSALMDGGAHPATLEVREDALILALEQRNFEALRKGHSEAAFKFFDAAGRQMTHDLRALSRYPSRSQGLRAFNRGEQADV